MKKHRRGRSKIRIYSDSTQRGLVWLAQPQIGQGEQKGHTSNRYTRRTNHIIFLEALEASNRAARYHEYINLIPKSTLGTSTRSSRSSR
eukprot:1325642-Amorphochlora_amoeboformis.AAC.1